MSKTFTLNRKLKQKYMNELFMELTKEEWRKKIQLLEYTVENSIINPKTEISC